MKNRYLTLLILAQLLILLISCEVPSEIDKDSIANKAPICKITEPAIGSTIYPTDITTIKAVIYDLDGDIESYNFLINDTPVPSNLILPVPGNDSTFYYTGTMLGLAPNSNNAYVITASAKDDGGKETKQDFVMTAGNYAPDCHIESPLAGSVVSVGSNKEIKVFAKDKDGLIDSVAFYVDGVKKSTLQGSSQDSIYKFYYTVTGGVSNHNFFAKAYDNNQLSSQSATVSVLVNNGNHVPTCKITSPLPDTFFSADSTRNIRITFNIADQDTTLGDNIDSVVYKVNNIRVSSSSNVASGNSYTMPIPASYFSSGFKNKISINCYDKSGDFGADSITINNVTAANVAFYDGFESYSNFDTSKVLIPYNNTAVTNWTQKDLDKGTTYVISGTTFPNQAYKGAFIIFNPSKTTPALSNVSHDGNKFAACFSNVQTSGVSPNNDWLITKKITIPVTFSAPKVTFWAKSYTTQYGLEKFGVYASNNGNSVGNGVEQNTSGSLPSVGDFKYKLSSQGNAYVLEEAPADWKNYTYDLSGVVSSTNRDIYITIACKSLDVFFLMVDDFMVFDAAMPSYTPKRIRHSNDPISKAVKLTNKPSKRTRK